MPGVKYLNDFAQGRVGSNLLDCCVLEVFGPSMCGGEVVFNAVLF